MANITRTNHGISRDPLSLARDLLGWDPFVRVDWPQRSPAATGFAPSFNVIEHDDAFTITADLPGVKDEDLDITVHDSQLLISGSRSAEERKEGESYYLFERSFGSFSRAFALPDNADSESIQADLKGGVLSVRVGKRESAKPRKVQLKRGS
jgi:HSP20 family protein